MEISYLQEYILYDSTKRNLFLSLKSNFHWYENARYWRETLNWKYDVLSSILEEIINAERIISYFLIETTIVSTIILQLLTSVYFKWTT